MGRTRGRLRTQLRLAVHAGGDATGPHVASAREELSDCTKSEEDTNERDKDAFFIPSLRDPATGERKVGAMWAHEC